jgi:hypothetical protein
LPALIITRRKNCRAHTVGPNIIKEWLNELRAGADSARIVANELDRAAEHLLTQAKEVR